MYGKAAKSYKKRLLIFLAFPVNVSKPLNCCIIIDFRHEPVLLFTFFYIIVICIVYICAISTFQCTFDPIVNLRAFGVTKIPMLLYPYCITLERGLRKIHYINDNKIIKRITAEAVTIITIILISNILNEYFLYGHIRSCTVL